MLIEILGIGAAVALNGAGAEVNHSGHFASILPAQAHIQDGKLPDYGIRLAPHPQYETPGSDATGCVSKINKRKYPIGCPAGGTSCCQSDTNDNGIAEWVLARTAQQAPATPPPQPAKASANPADTPQQPQLRSVYAESPSSAPAADQADAAATDGSEDLANVARGLAALPAEDRQGALEILGIAALGVIWALAARLRKKS